MAQTKTLRFTVFMQPRLDSDNLPQLGVVDGEIPKDTWETCYAKHYGTFVGVVQSSVQLPDGWEEILLAHLNEQEQKIMAQAESALNTIRNQKSNLLLLTNSASDPKVITDAEVKESNTLDNDTDIPF